MTDMLTAPAETPAPAAPAAPAPSAPATPAPVPAAPIEELPPNLAEALARRRQSLAASRQPRSEAGQFSAGGAPAQGAPSPDGEPETPADPTPEGEEPAPEAEPEPETPESEEEPEPELIRVALPARRADEPPVEIEVNDPEVAERLRQLNNGFLRGEEVRSQREAIQKEQGELAAVRDQAAFDPVGFVLDSLPEALRPDVALQLLANPQVWEQVAEHVESLFDQGRAEVLRAKLDARRYQLREELRSQRDARTNLQRQVETIQQAVTALVPESWDEDRRQLFLNDCLTDLGRWVRQMGASAVDAAQIPALLASRLRSVGLDPVTAADQMHRRLANGGAPAPTAPANGALAPTTPAAGASRRPVVTARLASGGPAAKGQPTGAELVAADAKRRQAAAAAPAGAVAPVATGGSDIPADARLEDVTRIMRERLRRG